MDRLVNLLAQTDTAIWGPVTLVFLLGTGLFLALGLRGVFIDTIIVCSMTALVIIITGAGPTARPPPTWRARTSASASGSMGGPSRCSDF